MSTIRRGETNSSHALDIMNGIIQEYLVPGEEPGHGHGLRRPTHREPGAAGLLQEGELGRRGNLLPAGAEPAEEPAAGAGQPETLAPALARGKPAAAGEPARTHPARLPLPR